MNEHLERVGNRISGAVKGFLDLCSSTGITHFYAEELRRHVEAECGQVAPSSATRILQDMRKRGKLDYRVINRRKSLYEIIVAKREVSGS